MNLSKFHNIYFIGIGGIGMSNLAQYLHHLRRNVWGYDKTASPVTEMLQKRGIEIYFDINPYRLANKKLDKSNTLIVYTPAIKRHEHRELDYLISHNFKVIKRSELLGLITKESICLAVAGTHGKTTTSALLGHILHTANFPATSFIGGVAENYNSNLILNGTKYTVVEADEYDRSFWQLHPNYACITATDSDHLDIYETKEAFLEGFKTFASQVTEKLFVHHNALIKGETFGLHNSNDFAALNIKVINGQYQFDLKTPEKIYKNLITPLPGKHNILNAVAAITLALSIGVNFEHIKKSLETFKGINRRFSYRVNRNDKILIDDYAHHPTELYALYNTVKELYPNECLCIYFQPHTYTRTRDFLAKFVTTLSLFDNIYILPIYAAREHPIEGISSENLVKLLSKDHKAVELVNSSEINNHIINNPNKIIVMAGAGDIGEIITTISKQI